MNPKDVTKEFLLSMPMSQTIEVVNEDGILDYYVTRVFGGWIYVYCYIYHGLASGHSSMTSIFVNENN